jgi:hypothetical protein
MMPTLMDWQKLVDRGDWEFIEKLENLKSDKNQFPSQFSEEGTQPLEKRVRFTTLINNPTIFKSLLTSTYVHEININGKRTVAQRKP